MNVNGPKITSLRAKVRSARQEFDMAVGFHEVWKPAAYDDELHKQMGISYATNAFYVVRVALRRETLLALMRLWDTHSNALRLDDCIAKAIRDRNVINALAADRVARMGLPQAKDQMMHDLGELRDKAIVLIDKYSKGGSHWAVRDKLWKLRNECLAHCQTKAMAVARADATDAEIESFYQDHFTLIRLLLSLVEAVAYNPKETAGVYRDHAALFWAGVRGERTEGHPKYRAPPSPVT